MRWPRATREAGLAVFVAGLVLALTMFDHSAMLRGLETASLDLRFRIRGVRKPGPEVAVVLVDDRSLAALGRWPLSRAIFARAVRTLDRDDAKIILFDLLFAEREQPIPPDLRQAARTAASGLAGSADPSLRSALRRLASDDPDAELAAAIRASGRVLLPIAFAFTGQSDTQSPPYVSASAYMRFDNSPAPPVFPLQPVSAVLPVPVLAEAAVGLGNVNIAYDVDGAPRYDYVVLPYNGDFIPSLPVRAAADYLGIPWKDVGLALGAGIHLGPITIPTDRAGRLLINYCGPRGTIPTYSFIDLLQGSVPKAALKGRIVLLGASFLGSSDSNPSPFGTTQLPGTERMATIIDMILHRAFIREGPPPWGLIVIAAVLTLALLTGIAGALMPTRFAVLCGLGPLVIWCLGVQYAFERGLWLPFVGPIAAIVATTVAVLLFRYRVVDAEGRVIKRAFRHYLAPEMVNVLAAHPERLQLGGEMRTMTLLFCDVRGFTTISEQFKANPEGLTRLINRFLTPMTDVIMARRGTIDKYMGDCIMAFWNAPLADPSHADHACESALAMMTALEAVNAGLAAEARAEKRPFLPLRVGIGLNTGDCVVGNVGSDQRFDYSVLGDAVNLASRLEGQSKTYHVPIVIGDETRAAAPSWAALELDLIEVKGKEEAVRVYTLLGDKDFAATDAFRALVADHDQMIGRYRRRQWEAARAALACCRNRDPRLELFYDLYAERIRHYEANPPGPDWQGVFIATTK